VVPGRRRPQHHPPDGTIAWASPSITELLGFATEDLIGRSVLDLVDPTDRTRVLDGLASAEARARAGAPAAWEGVAPTVDVAAADGHVVRCQVSVATGVRTGLDQFVIQVRRAGGTGWLHEALTAMAEGRELRTVITHLVAMTELDLPWVRLSVAWDWDGERFLHAEGGPAALDLTHPWGSPELFTSPNGHRRAVADLPPGLARAAADAGMHEVWLCPLVDHRRRALVAAWHVGQWPMTAFTQAALERTARLVGVAMGWDHDRHALDWAARHDALTGLRNRAAFLRDLSRALTRPVSVLYIDLDDFKPVNDDFGHALGDQVLAALADRIRSVVRPTDVVARLGGDEFAVLCPGLADEGQADRLAQRLVDAAEAPVDVDGISVRVGLSVGVAGVVEGDHSADELLKRADDALRQAKAEGKRRWLRARIDGPIEAARPGPDLR
jgi:diguanylate cyclase (GGDEF)-like protein